MFEYMVGHHREKGRSGHGKWQNFTSQQLQLAYEEYDEASRLCIFCLESLKQGQSRSLLTQATRHHAAQRRLLTLKAVELHIEDVTGKKHIDYKLCESDNVEDSYNEKNNFQTYDDGEISFDYRQTEELENACTSKSSTQINSVKNELEKIHSPQPRESSHSTPIYAEKLDPIERIREMQAAVQKLNTYVLPTLTGEKSSTSKTSNYAVLSTPTSIGRSTKNPWHSSPLNTKKYGKFTEHNKSPFVPLPLPLAEGAAVSQWDTHRGYNIRQAFSGSLASKPSYNKLLSSTNSGPIGSTESPQCYYDWNKRRRVSRKSHKYIDYMTFKMANNSNDNNIIKPWTVIVANISIHTENHMCVENCKNNISNNVGEDKDIKSGTNLGWIWREKSVGLRAEKGREKWGKESDKDHG
ncbi:Uncharacterized protein Fot_14544 [Forsythia ovata]|uniref:Uncharacterized protein n=1 Tax=Forsythia ovata TaxID=205694 RepID=A0ABD1W6M1_9LAMI